MQNRSDYMPTSQRIADTNRRSCRIATVAPLAVLLTVLVLVGTAMFDTYEHSPAPSQHAAGHALSHSASRHCIIGKELHIRTNRTDSTTNKDYVVRLVENQASAQSSSRFFRYSNRMADAPKAVGSNGGRLEFAFPSGMERVYVEVGTNRNPHCAAVVLSDPHAMLIGLEPQPEVFATMVRNFRDPKRLLAIPAAVAPQFGFLPMHVSNETACTSILPMSAKAHALFSKYRRVYTRRKPNPFILQEECTAQARVVEVPSLPLQYILNLIPRALTLVMIMVDAQGYDTTVLSTLGMRAFGAAFVVAECQDLPHNHSFMIVESSANCAEQVACMANWLPHRLEYCWENNHQSSEFNCVYRNPAKQFVGMPDPFPQARVRIKSPRHSPDPTFKCPPFMSNAVRGFAPC